MQIISDLSDKAVLGELGARLERTRLERNLTQRQLAAEAGVERKAVQRLEAGEPVKLTSFVRVLRALGMLDALERLVPEPLASPIELLERRGETRRRASGPRRRRHLPRADTGTDGGAGAGADADASPAWRWGDEEAGSKDR